jgi:enoyl-CoA hydratase/carnithine racemase
MCSNGRLRDRLGALEQAVDALLSCDLTTVPDSELGTSLARLESRTRTLVGLTARLAHEHNHRNGPVAAAPDNAPTRETAHPAENPAAAAPNRTSHSPRPTRSGIVADDRSTVARGVTVTAPVRVERTGDVVVWTIDNPEQRNPISDEATIEALENAVRAADRDHSIRVAILTGAGTAFSAGGNVKHMRDKAGMFGGTPADLRQGYRHGIQRIPKALYHCEIPTIAAVNGPAIGAGCDLALMCDMRIAATTATFAESFVRLGLIPGDGGAWLLPRAVGMARASQLAFTGAAIDAATALDWGMVNEVVEPDRLLDTAHRLAAEIAVNPPHALRMTKRLLREGQQQSLETLLELSAAMQALTHHTADHDEAVAAMLERRTPRFTGQ